MKTTYLAAIGLLAAALGGCKASMKDSAAPPNAGYPTTNQSYGPGAPESRYEAKSDVTPLAAPPGPDAGGLTAEASRTAPHEPMKPSAPTQQPGLATSWGETLSSQVTSAAFARADRDHPFVTAAIYYNDAEGIAAMSDIPSGARTPSSVFALHDGFLEVGLRDGSGQPLNGFNANQDHFVTGRAGERYVIVVKNHSPGRIEAVVSVDGLDVVDGKAASFAKRGYLLDPNGALEIEGFRTSENAVAAFRFGSVRDSYAALKHGDTRNVGVIGAAFFHERGDDPWGWTRWRNEDVVRRQNANPFPAQFATPPDR